MVDSGDILIATMPARGWQASGCFLVLLVLSCGRAASAQITSATVSGIIRDQTGAALPGVAVTVKNLETQLTRSAVTADDGSYSIAGLPPGLYEARAVLQGFATALLDGANMSGYGGLAVANAADTTLGLDTIREFRVVTNAFPADYGRAMGGIVSVITKSGTNEFRGSAFEFFRNDTLDARNYFDDEKPSFERHQFGSTASGPVRKNRTFFFGGVRRLGQNLGVAQGTGGTTMGARAGTA